MTITGLAQNMRELQSAVITITGLVGNVAEAQTKTDARLQQFAEAQAAQAAAHAEQIAALTEAQAHTDDRLNALIDVADKLIRRNGSSGSPQ